MSVLAQLEAQIDASLDVEIVADIDKWIEREIYIPFGEKKGFIDLNVTPWAREPILSLVDPDVKTEAGIYGTQMAKTTQGTLVALAAAARLRLHFAWMWPKVDAARRFSKSRLRPIVDASPTLRALKPEDSDLFNNLEFYLRNGGAGFLVGSHSAIDQKSASVPVVIVDEIENLAAASEEDTDPITAINERSKTFTDRKLFLFGSCLLETGPAWQQYLLGDQRHYLVPCPDCGTRQALEFRGAVWLINRSTGELELRGRAEDFRLWWDPAARQGEHDWDYDAVRRTACYVCAECGAQLRDEHKRQMILAGQWTPTTKPKIYGHRSRRINSLYPLWAATSYPSFAVEFLGSRTSTKKLQNFTNNWEAKPWVTGLDLSDRTALARRLKHLVTDAEQGVRVGERTVMLVDVQRHHLVWAWFGFDAAGSVHLLDCGYTRDFDSLRELDDKLSPDHVAIDTRHRPQEVYEAIHARRTRWIALRGEDSGKSLSPNFRFDPFTGDKSGRQGLYVITLLHLHTWFWGEEFLNRLYPAQQEAAALPGAKPGETSAPEHADNDSPRIHDFRVFASFPKQADFVQQLFSTYLIDYIDAAGRPQRKWKESKNDHLFDLCKYVYALGSFLGYTRVAIQMRKAVADARAAAAAEASKQPELDLTKPQGGTSLYQ